MAKPTDKQIEEEIQWLRDNKSKIPESTLFGDSNWEAIDTQILVLRERATEDECYDVCSSDESTEPSRDLEHALDAARWLEGEEECRPSAPDHWGSLVRK